MGKQRRKFWRWLLLIPALLLAAYLVYLIPPVHDRLSWRIDDLRTRMVYFFNPPDEAVFLPSQDQELERIVEQTLAAANATAAQQMATATATPNPADTATPIPTATLTPTAIPESVILDGVTYVDQHSRWNYCGPANLTMALNYWGWQGDRDDVARVVKPGVPDVDDFVQAGKPDKNVMPYELTDFVASETSLKAVLRIGGDIQLIKGLISAGFPVVIEKGYYEADYTGKVAWLGHYLFVTGYDDAGGHFIVQDAYLEPGENLESDYEEFIEGWRSFNYTFFVVYPAADEAEVLALLGPWADLGWSRRHALEIANQETQELEGIDEFFAWFNKGSSHVALTEYSEAAFAYDTAFTLYAQLENDDTQRPYRIMWYQTGPYWAYHYTGRYNDEIELANTTLETVSDPTLEESLYWRGMGYLALGENDKALADFLQAVYINPGFEPGLQVLSQMGVSP